MIPIVADRAVTATATVVVEEKKDVPFLRFHAVQSIALNIAIWVLIILLITVTLGLGGICAPLLWLVTLWPAYDSFQGNFTEIPVITKFIKGQGWG